MPESRKKTARKAAIAFISVMIFFTFTSKTINYFMMPKVTASKVESGYLRYNIPVKEVRFYSENETEVVIPEKLKRPFIIGSIHFKEGDVVSQGDTLVTFEISSHDSLIKEAEREVARLRIEFMEFDKNYSSRVSQLEKDILDLDVHLEKYREALAVSCENTDELISRAEEIRKLTEQYHKKAESPEFKNNMMLHEAGILPSQEIEKMKSELKSMEEQVAAREAEYEHLKKKLIEDYENRLKEGEYRRGQLAKELEYIKSSGILNGKSKSSIEKELMEAEQWMELILKHPDIRSPVDGVVTRVFYDTNGSYDGLKPILLIKPEGEIKSFIVSLADSYRLQDADDILKEDAPCVLKYGRNDISGKIAGIIAENGKSRYIINLDKPMGIDPEIKLPQENEMATLEVRGDYCDILIPNSALTGNGEVYALRTRGGFWGKEYYAARQEVRMGRSNEYYTEIKDGLSRSDMVITGWDRALQDGATVTFPLE